MPSKEREQNTSNTYPDFVFDDVRRAADELIMNELLEVRRFQQDFIQQHGNIVRDE